jgi:hypothetical protein
MRRAHENEAQGVSWRIDEEGAAFSDDNGASDLKERRFLVDRMIPSGRKAL